eukprot:TRINITY_DN5373_c0_g1_i5.p1 TRINITY_DN5373_c0_g1~~TRINITY_DN5373_c0_g1_i5.p1  ORF type:complete len:378 (+),score=60.86 TRINITY_DN5373_c0_g1_i5:143-1276(+)
MATSEKCGALFIAPRPDPPCRNFSKGYSRVKDGSSSVTPSAFVEEGRASDDDHVHIDSRHLDEDVFSLAIMAAVRDGVAAEKSAAHRVTHTVRMATSMGLALGNFGVQCFLILSVKRYVCMPAVMSIRASYEAFVKDMYGDNTVLYEGQYLRGIQGDEHFNNFDKLDKDMQTTICNIPLSYPCFLQVVLLIWTMTCVGEIRKCTENLVFYVWHVPTLNDMTGSIVDNPEDEHQKLVLGLTTGLKSIIALGILLPRVLLTALLMWVGCRWLTATASFGDVIINSIALEFILLTKDLVYVSMVPQRSKIDVQNTVIKVSTVHVASLQAFLVPLLWLVASIAWVFVYSDHLQHVIPYYGWDVSIVCTHWLDKQFPNATFF